MSDEMTTKELVEVLDEAESELKYATKFSLHTIQVRNERAFGQIRKRLQKQGPCVTREDIGVIVQSLQDFKGHEVGMKYLANKLTETGVKVKDA